MADRLTLKGFDVLTPTLSGMEKKRNVRPIEVTLDTHISDVCSIIESKRLNDVVLVGHSYGGMPITGVADKMPGRIRALVYLDAMIPENQKSALDVRYPSSHPFPPPDGNGLIPPVDSSRFNLSGEMAVWVNDQLSPQPPKTVSQPIKLTGAWSQVPQKIYLRATCYKAPWFDRFLAEKSSDPGWETYSYPWGHDMMITHPEELADLLTAFAKSPGDG